MAERKFDWLRSYKELGDHPKLGRLARELGTSRPAAVGHLHYLWWWALDYADDGDLSRWDDAEIAAAARWEGDAAAFVKALGAVGFFDEGPALHDWEQYHGSDTPADGTIGAHVRWHVNRSVVDPDCPHCTPPDAGNAEGNATAHAPQDAGNAMRDAREEERRGDKSRGEKSASELLAKYLGKLAGESPNVWGKVTSTELLEIGAEYGFDAATVGRMLGDVWEWWRTLPASRRWKSAALKGWRRWCKTEAERQTSTPSTSRGDEDRERELRRTKLVARLRGEYGDKVETVVDRTLERFPTGPIDSLAAFARDVAREEGLA